MYFLHVSLVSFWLIINNCINIQFYSTLTYYMHIWILQSEMSLVHCVREFCVTFKIHFMSFSMFLFHFSQSGFFMFIYTKSSLLLSFVSWSHSSNLFVLFMRSMFPWRATVFQALCSPLQYFTTRMKITQTTFEIFWAIYLFTSIIIFR